MGRIRGDTQVVALLVLALVAVIAAVGFYYFI